MELSDRLDSRRACANYEFCSRGLTMIEIKPDGEIDSKEKDPDKIDYMHPEGKPPTTPEQKQVNREEKAKPVSKSALVEADGHHVCTESCLGKH
jgi:hypothetical protein